MNHGMDVRTGFFVCLFLSFSFFLIQGSSYQEGEHNNFSLITIIRTSHFLSDTVQVRRQCGNIFQVVK